MLSSSVTISLVPEAKGGPFVFWGDLAGGCAQAAAIGFDAVEVFPPSPDAIAPETLRALLTRHGLKLAAVGSGAGWVIHRLRLTHADAQIRLQARQFIARMIDFAAPFGAPVIIGSMQGRFEDGIDRTQALAWLAEGLNFLGEHASQRGVGLFYEPLNRYETNLINQLGEGVEFLKSLSTANVKLLADLFHMNIEEPSLPAAIREHGAYIGHLHFVDSNRRAAGQGHIDFAPIALALREAGYTGYASVEALPLPDPETAARLSLAAFKRYFEAGLWSP